MKSFVRLSQPKLQHCECSRTHSAASSKLLTLKLHVCVELDATNHKQLDTNNKVSHQHDKLEDIKDDMDHSIARLRDHVIDLEDQVCDLELLNIEPANTFCCCKLPHHGSRTSGTTSPSSSRHTLSRVSCPVSPMDGGPGHFCIMLDHDPAPPTDEVDHWPPHCSHFVESSHPCS